MGNMIIKIPLPIVLTAFVLIGKYHMEYPDHEQVQ